MIGAIENAILAQLRAAEAGFAYKFHTLDTFPDQDFDQYLEFKGKPNPPMAWVAFGGVTRMEAVSPGISKATGVFVVICGTSNLRNETAQRQGAAGKVGSYQIALDVTAALQGRDLGLEIAPMRPMSIQAVQPTKAIRDRSLSLFGVGFETDFEIERVVSDTGDFTTFHANWDVPPFGGVDADSETAGVQLPADAQADLSDEFNPQEEG